MIATPASATSPSANHCHRACSSYAWLSQPGNAFTNCGEIIQPGADT